VGKICFLYGKLNAEFVKVNVKVKMFPVIFLNSAPQHDGVLGEWMYSATHSLTSKLDKGEWPASRPSRFTPGKEPMVPIR
jgi:hypothetical protein